jgi:uncharacterized repeat protein (TIGR03803 family)
MGGSNGGFPLSGVVRNSAGNLFGTTRGGNGALSTLYEVSQSGEEATLFSFDNFVDGDYANSAPTLADGNLFGTTLYGGDSSCGFNGNGCGVVYEMKKNGTFSLLYTFTSLAEGIEPTGSSPVVDAKGDLFGVTELGGDLTCDPPNGCGVVFELDHTGKYRVLHKFTGQADGSYPACVIDDGAGGLFGVTENGGDLSCGFYGCGTIFRMDKTGGLTTLYAFPPITENNDGHSCLSRDYKGNLYGTNALGGTHNAGYLAVLSTSDTYTILYDFPISNSPQGGVPLGVALGPGATFFGVNSLGGDPDCGVENSGCGTVFELTPESR